MESFNLIQQLAIWTLPVLFAITVHEVAHGWVARLHGDKTAMMLGRLTLNPIKHIDPVGTVALPLLLVAMQTGFVFGWAKPVPVTLQNLRNPRRDMVWVALAGPLSNGIMALIWLGLIMVGSILLGIVEWVAIPLLYMGEAGVKINVVLMVLNLVPLLPLDGGRVVSGLLPSRLSWQFDRIEPYGMVVVLVLLATGLLGQWIGPVIHGVLTALFSLLR